MTQNRRRHITFDQPRPHFYPIPQFIRVGRLQGPRRYVKPEHPHAENEWILIRRGQLRIWIDGVPLEVGAGDLYFIQPGQTHREESLREPLDFYALRFHFRDLTGKPVHFVPRDPKRQLIRRAGRSFLALFDEIFLEVWSQKPGGIEIVEAVILQMIQLSRRRLHLWTPSHSQHVSQRQQALAEHAQQYLLAGMDRKVSLRELGQACCLSPDHLRRVFKEATGMSPIRYAMSLRMNEAKRLLAEPSLPVYEVAQRVGFDDPYHFSRQFKMSTGVSPQAFRQNI